MPSTTAKDGAARSRKYVRRVSRRVAAIMWILRNQYCRVYCRCCLQGGNRQPAIRRLSRCTGVALNERLASVPLKIDIQVVARFGYFERQSRCGYVVVLLWSKPASGYAADNFNRLNCDSVPTECRTIIPLVARQRK